MKSIPAWLLFSLGSAFFAGLTAILGICYYRALQLAPASLVAPIDKLSVAFAILLGVLVLREAFTWRVGLGGALIVAGAVVIATS